MLQNEKRFYSFAECFFMLCLSPEAIPFFYLTPFAMLLYPFNSSIVPLLHSNSAAFEAQMYRKWSAIVLLLR